MQRNPEMYTYRVPSTSTSTSTLFNKNIDYNRLARKTGIANQADQLKKNNVKGEERKETILSYNK